MKTLLTVLTTFIMIMILLKYGLVWVVLGSYFLTFLVTLYYPKLMNFNLLWGLLFLMMLMLKLMY